MNKQLEALKQEGYFVVSRGEHAPGILVMECKIYLTDTDENGGATRPLVILPDEPLIWEGKCRGCNALATEAGVGARPFKRGSIKCPLCASWTEPWSMQERVYRGLFKLVSNGPAEFIPNPPVIPDPHEMRSQHQIECISKALVDGAESR